MHLPYNVDFNYIYFLNKNPLFFNSLDFAVFLPLVFILYWFVFHRDLAKQNILVVAASYLFYGWWDYRFLSLLVVSTLIDFMAGRALGHTEDKNKRKVLLYISILSNLSILGFFKYYNFFIDSFSDAFTWFGYDFSVSTLHIVLPVGISFYTFQTMSYTIDVFRKKMSPTYDLVAFTAYVSFFPQLVAGPIERAQHLLPQFFVTRRFDYQLAVVGCRQILWGFFKKLVIADNCAVLADQFFDHHSTYPGSALLLGAFFFSFQIYGDFSGYSDIAIGLSRLFGFDLRKNFAFPYFSRDIAEFWRRWHISLSTWFRDYVYIPLGGNQGDNWTKVRNIFIVFVISGFWHGANMTFIVWGAVNALLFLPLLLMGKNRQHLNIVAFEKTIPSFKELLSMILTFMTVTLLWIFFRSANVGIAFDILAKIFSTSLFTLPDFENHGLATSTLILIFFFISIEWAGRAHSFAIESLMTKKSTFARWSFYSFLVALIGMYMHTGGSPFIYFQF